MKIKIKLFFLFILFLRSLSSYAQPEPCIGTPAMTSTCLDACVICDIDGFTGTNNLSIQGQTFPGFCTTQYHNMSYIAFIAGTAELTIQVTVTNCTINWGLEISLFESPDCETFIPVSDCNTDVQPNGTATFSNLSALTVGQHYYLIMDGSNGDICDWTFNVIEGSTAVLDLTTSGVISGNSEICPDLATPYSTTGDAGDTFGLVTSFQGLGAGAYTFNIMDDNECQADTIGELIAPDIPVLYLDDQLETKLGCDIRIPTSTNNTNLINIQWSNGATLDCDTCLRPLAFPLEDTEYFITVTSIDTCSTSDSIAIQVIKVRDIFVPNVFSPNGDGFNDYFYINANKSVALIKSMKVFSRWGGLVYAGNDLPPNERESGWDGYSKGKLMPEGVYVWLAEVEYLDGEVLMVSGDVSLVL